MRVLVTAAGAGPGVAVIKAIKRYCGDYDPFVLAVDLSKFAAGLYLADKWSIVPPSRDPNYVESLLKLCVENKIEMIIPIFDTETPLIAEAREMFKSIGVHVAVNSREAIDRANDKEQSFSICENAGISQPARFKGPEHILPTQYPIIVKPIDGVGAKGIFKYNSPEEIPSVRNYGQNNLWQRFIEGEEFTIDTFGDPQSDKFIAVPRLRRVVKAGQMVQGSTVKDKQLQEFARQVCTAFGATNVSCVQVIRSAEGLNFIEINPRYGTGVSLSIAAGVNFPLLQWLSFYKPEKITPQMLEFRDGLEMLRYWEEVYI